LLRSFSRAACGVLTSHWLPSAAALYRTAENMTISRTDPFTVNLQRLILWVDTMCPYRGEEEIRDIPDPEFQGVDWLAVRPRIKTAPLVSRPGPLN